MKKLTKEDTWKTDELKKHMRGYEEDSIKRGEKMRRSEDERRHRSGVSVDRRHRDRDREERRDGERLKEREQKERTKHRELERDKDLDRRREDSREKMDERNERERERRKDREKDRGLDTDRYRDGERGSKDRRYDRAEKENREKERERERYKETMSEREKEKERDRRRAEKERDRRSDRDRKKDEDRDIARDVAKMRLQDGEMETERDRRERHRSRGYMKETEHHREGKDKNRERDRKERHGDREQSGYREGREHRREKEEVERRRRERDLRGGGEMRDSERERRHREQKGSEGRVHGDRDRDQERERKERDRHREKRHGEESDQTKREIQNTASSHKHRDHRGDKEVENEEKTSGEDYEEVDYEEDFEDYEEDFEDVDEDEHGSEEEKEEADKDLSPERREEIRAIQRAMDEENERVGSSQSRPTTQESLPPRTDTQTRQSRPQRGVIDFVSAKRREVNQKVSSRQKKRSAELLRMIDLDFSITFSLLDLPPVNEYDMYIKSFGTTNTRQAYVQCNEDNTDREVQTEETDMSDKWTQHPAEFSVSCGGPDQSQNAVGDTALRTNFDSRRLVSFLRSATQVMSVLLEEDRAEKHALTRLKSQSDSLSFSDGCLQLNTRLPFLHGRQVSHLHFSDAQRQTLLSVHAPSSMSSAIRLDSQSIICVWNIWEPSRPQKILVYESEVCCCCLSPGKAMLVFAGTSVGSVVLWDLREPSSSHYSLTIGESDWTLRYPTFSTDAVLSGSGHLSAVQSVEPVSVPVSEGLRPELPLLANQEESLGLSFQLASLDEKGVLNLWVVVELPKSSDAGSQTDLGLRPGGKVKLLHSSSLQTCDSGSSLHDLGHPGPLQALLLKFLPSDSSHYFIGTNMGVVNHGTRHGLKAPPKFYCPLVAGFRPVQVSSLEFCPSGQPHFLVGCDDGSVRLHSVQSEQPLLEWTGSTAGEEVVSVQWALTRPAVFCVLDAASCLHIWDLVEDDQRPVLTERIDVDRVTTMAVFGDPAKQNTYSGIALAKHSGRIEIHYLRKRFTVPTPADSEKLDSLIQDAF
ncbi:cytoplasmic dynein 2 intermediate chain 1 isoform X2 [Alosa sapidissima]|uniref:cytoplasmic dynein 2 intermediate chain 1 isoform X2 n=1 Tax=Alosa sapidissima TaxID=34773 RepID=UPI001C0952D3|nr:cytoplasmic dynein 2 intermediate chain 1 isoform X2 [Alosa sapidissima]